MYIKFLELLFSSVQNTYLFIYFLLLLLHLDVLLSEVIVALLTVINRHFIPGDDM